MRTLIVEDDFTSRTVLQAYLTPCSECHIAVNGREAVEAFQAAQKIGQVYDLICMDIMMPEMDGHAAVREIRHLEEAAGTPCSSRVKIIMTTALDDQRNVTQSLLGSCDAYLIKPVAREKLLSHIKDLHLV